MNYMAEHLTPNGRAGIIVPEGIIFQSQTAYTELRKMLVDSSLVAVISLPAGVFNPYSGVKTSILILDKALAKEATAIAFFKVENDGFGLGAQRREIDKNDLPQVRTQIGEYLCRLRTHESLEDIQPTLGLVVPKEKIAENGDYNLSGERYKENSVRASVFQTIRLGELCELIGGSTPSKQDESYWTNGTVKWISSKHVDERGHITGYELISKKAVNETSTGVAPRGSTIIITRVSVGKFAFADEEYAINQDLTAIVSKDVSRLAPEFIRVVAHHIASVVERSAEGIGVRGVTRNFLSELKIPLPPLKVQKEIVGEIEGYQKVIDGSRAVVDNYRPHIPIHPDWPMVPLEETCEIQRGKFAHRPRNEPRFYGGKYPFIQTGDIVRANGGKIAYTQTLNEDGLSVSRLFQPPVVVITIAANIGDTAVLDFPSCFPDSVVGLIPKQGTDAHFLELAMRTKKQHLNDIAPQAAQKNINIEILKTLEIPLPPMATQQAIVAEIEAERVLVNANRELITRMEKKIQATLARVWGEETGDTPK